jgi:hypothetical protein
VSIQYESLVPFPDGLFRSSASRKMKFIFEHGLIDVTYDSLAFKGQSDYYRRPLLETFGFGVYYTISQLMSQLGALRESDFDLHIQQYDKKDRFNLLSVS